MSTPRPRLLLVGNGMAGVRTLEELLRIAPEHYDITVLGSEPCGNYNRIGLSPVLAGEQDFASILSHPRDWYTTRNITLHTGDPAVAIDRSRRRVRSSRGLELPYERLLLATGSTPFMPPVAGHTLPGVTCFRDIEDVRRMQDSARCYRRAVVVGGGLLGLEAASGLLRQGMDVTVIHLHPQLMERQLDPHAATLLQQELERRGLRFVLGGRTAAIIGRARVTALRLEDGRELETDLVVMAAGVRPQIALAQQAGLYCERGIVVDDTLQTLTDPRIHAVGECAQHRGATYGLVAPLYEQARICALHLAGLGYLGYAGSMTSTRLKVSGIDLFSAGAYAGGAGTEDLVLHDPRRGVYRRLVLKANRIVGILLYGDTTDGPWYFELMQRGTDIGPWRAQLIFGRGYCEWTDQAA